MDYNADYIADNIRAERTRRRIQAQEIAGKMGIAKSTFYAKENGKSEFTVSELISISHILGVPVAALLDKPA